MSVAWWVSWSVYTSGAKARSYPGATATPNLIDPSVDVLPVDTVCDCPQGHGLVKLVTQVQGRALARAVSTSKDASVSVLGARLEL